MGMEQFFVIRKRGAWIGADRFHGLKIHENWLQRETKEDNPTKAKTKSKPKAPHVKPTCGAPRFISPRYVGATRQINTTSFRFLP
ncbi:MAG: hypothetical protein WBE70_18270, partial [Candidatus Acidiferrum sp.]